MDCHARFLHFQNFGDLDRIGNRDLVVFTKRCLESVMFRAAGWLSSPGWVPIEVALMLPNFNGNGNAT